MCPTTSLLLLLAVLLGGTAAATPRTMGSARKLLIEPPPPPLIVKSHGCFYDPSLEPKIAADVAAVDAYAADSNRQGLTYAGTVSNLVAELGSFDMLIVYARGCDEYQTPPQVFSAAEQAALETALATGSLKKLMVWHSYNDHGIDNRVPGVYSVGCGSHWDRLEYLSANPALYASVGPNPPSSDEVLYAYHAAHGVCPLTAVLGLNSGVAHTWNAWDASSITAFSHCYQGRGAVFYAQMPIEYWLVNVDRQRLTQFHANAISVFSNDINCPGPPTCPVDVVLSATWLPPNNKMFDVSLTSVPLQDPPLPGNVTVNSVEFFDVLKGRRPTFPLAVIVPPSESEAKVSLRAERNGAGRGRLYRIKYTAANAAGSCNGVAFVCVPHDASAFNSIENLTYAVGVSAPLDTAPKVTCPVPSSIAEDQWMATTAP